MIRRDYILRMIEEFIQMLSRLKSLKRDQLWREASELLNQEFQRLIETDAAAATRLSDTELLAKLIKGEPTQAVREKTFLLTALFKEAGDLAITENRMEEGRAFYLRGLDLLLEALAQDQDLPGPEFVPEVEAMLAALQDRPLPIQTSARLMQHYERTGQYAKAEDCLFAMLDSEPQPPGLVEFGITFYERLQNLTDATLLAGNLPRAELEAGLRELKDRVSVSPQRP